MGLFVGLVFFLVCCFFVLCLVTPSPVYDRLLLTGAGGEGGGSGGRGGCDNAL